MLKHPEIVAKLNTLQKASLVASAFAEGPFKQADLPAVRSALLGELAKQSGVSYGSAVRSWDPALVGNMTAELALEAGKEGARLFVSPDLKVALDPHTEGLSEDGYFNGVFGGEAVRAVHAVGGAAGLSRLSLTAEETAYLDRREDAAAVHDVVIKPFRKATEEEGCDVVFSDPKRLGTGYYHTNRVLFSEALGGAYGDAFAVGEGDPAADSVKLLHGKVSLGGAAIPLERALRRYAQLAVYAEEGSVQQRDLEEALRDGSAFDGATLDAVTDEIIDLALRLEGSELHAPVQAAPAPAPVPPVQTAPAEVCEQPASEGEEPPAREGAPAEGGEGESPAEPAPEEAPEPSSPEAPAEASAEEIAEAAAPEDNTEEASSEEVAKTPAPAPAESAETAPAAAFVPPVPAAPVPADAARRAAAEECIVLLKNDGLLPLARGTKLAVLGEAYGDLSGLEARFEIVGKAVGYDLAEARSDEFIPEAVRATGEAEAVLVFLCSDGAGRGFSLPANRIALIDALKKAKKRVVALVCGDLPVDMRFDDGLSASLLAPAGGPYAGEALARVLAGEVNPSGRVTRTVYDDADAYFRAYREDRDNGRMHVGSFVGYRRYVTVDEKVRYPFGYGIGYSKFTYTDLRIYGDTVSFTLTNIGKYDGSEVVQVYMGVPKTSHVVAKRQLIAFQKVFLRAGEHKKVTFELPAARYATYNHRLFAEDVETGVYRIFVGASVLDIRLQGKRQLTGVAREPIGDAVADYFPNADYVTVAKVGQDNRVVPQERMPKAEKLQLARKAAIYAMPVVAILFFVLLTILILSYALDYVLLSYAGAETMKWILYVAAIGVIAVIPLLGGLNRKRVALMRTVAMYLFPVLFGTCFILGVILISPNGGEGEEIALRVMSCFTIGVPILAIVATLVERDLWRTQTGSNHWDKFYFERKRDARTATAPLEFEEAFRAAERARAEREAAQAALQQKREEAEEEIPQFYDKRLTYDQLLADCKKYAEERGLIVDDATLRNYFGAITAAQLVIVPSGDGAALCETVAAYLGKRAYIDNAEKYRRYDDLYVSWKQNGRTKVSTELSTAIEATKYESAYLHTVLIRHVAPSLLEPLFRPVAEALARKRTALPLAGEENVMFPANLIIVAELESDRVTDLPGSVTEAAAVLAPVCEHCEPALKKTVMQAVGAERFAAMRQAVRDDYPLTEQCWKNVDLLDEICKSARIGNRIWLKIELHAAVCAACGCGAEEALDGALAAEALPWLSTVWKNDVCGETLPEALVEVFGEENIRLGLAALAPEEEQ